MKFRKRPVVIEAIQWTGKNKDEIDTFVGQKLHQVKTQLLIETLEGAHMANQNDWIIRGVNGEFYPCKPDIFKKTYEGVD